MKRLVLIVFLTVCCLAPVGQSAGQQPTLTYPFFGMEWSPDGTSVAFTSKEGAWLYSGGSYYEITLGPIDDVTWSPDGRFIALLRHDIGADSEVQFTGYIEIWDVSSPSMPSQGQIIKDGGMSGDVENLDWSPTGNLIAVSGRGIRIWSATTGVLVRTIATDQISSDVQWSPNEFSVASFSEVLNVWNGLTGELLHSIDFPLYVDSGSWGLHRQQVAVVQSNYDTKHELNLLDLSQPHPELLPLILTADNPVGYTEWKGNTVASGTTEGIQLWDVSTQQTITMISVSGLWNFALSPDGSQIAYIRKDGVLQIQTVNTPFVSTSTEQQPTLTYPFFGMEWSPDGTSVAFTSKEGAWLYSGGSYYEITLGPIDDVTWSPDGRFIALLRHNQYHETEIMFTGYIEIWDMTVPTMPVFVRTMEDNGMKGGDIENLDWSPTSNLIAVSGRGIRIWNTDTGELVRTLQSNEFSIGVQWNPDGVSVASFVESLTLWNGLTGDLQDSIQLPLLIYFGSWGNDGQHIAVVQSSFGVYDQIDILNLSQPKTDSSPIVLLSDIYLTNIDWKGNTLAGFTYGGIQLWDVPTQQSIINIPLTGSNNFALSPDGSKIAYIQDGVLQIQTVNTPYVAPTPTPIAD